ncbi:unnamed protein product [Paramecium sonneborni]|uniref:Carbohydrate-binding domain-containing protein n=1 Tax=Paramecium sonneborni TaxID=65129 RepID=A0A8S1RAN5_9CILI|nr:unnamed protein product [Paramecium sonneborni]
MILIFAIIIVISNAVIDPITIENCKWGPTQYKLGHQNEQTTESVEFTYFTICKSLNHKIVIDFFNVDSYIDAPLTNCNDPLFQHDVDEIFIGTKTEYLEIEISPNGALFYATIGNPNGNCSNLITTYRQCDEIKYFAEYVTPTAWNAHIELPISMFTQPIYANFYRVNKMKDHTTHYMSYNPINASPACFHRPDKFIQLIV